MRWLLLLLLAGGLSGVTTTSWVMATAGVGLDDDFNQTASIRSGSAGGSRVYVGGGIHSGK